VAGIKRISLVVGLIAVVGAIALPATAADTKRFKTTVTIDDNNKRVIPTARRNITFQFFGQVRSQKKACRKGRTVVLKDMNVEGKAPPTNVGSGKSDAQGNWSVSISNKPFADAYVATAKPKRLGNGDRCRAGKSPKYFYVPY
jgi:hypothetical protein